MDERARPISSTLAAGDPISASWMGQRRGGGAAAAGRRPRATIECHAASQAPGGWGRAGSEARHSSWRAAGARAGRLFRRAAASGRHLLRGCARPGSPGRRFVAGPTRQTGPSEPAGNLV